MNQVQRERQEVVENLVMVAECHLVLHQRSIPKEYG